MINEDELHSKFMIDAGAGITNVLSGELKSYKVRFLCHADIKTILEGLGGEHIDFESNGWQWDTWEYWKVGDKNITVEGEGYYGGLNIYLGGIGD